MRVRVQKKYFFEFKFEFGKNDGVQRVRVRSPATFTFHSQRAKKSSSENLVESKKKDHHVRRSPIFRPKSSEEQKKKVITSAGRSLSCATVF